MQKRMRQKTRQMMTSTLFFTITVLPFFSDDNYDMRNIIHLKSRATDTDDMDDFVTGAFFYAQKQGSILVNDEKNCYSSLSEMANEFQETLGEYLPNDFDYEAHLCWFCGANFS